MPNRARVVILAALAAACARAPEPKGCRADDQCPPQARCAAAVCVTNERPVAAIRPLAAVESFALVHLDGSESRTAEADVSVISHAWTIHSVTAPCPPPEIAGVEPIARVRFGCPGRYQVSLTVRDGRGVESAPATSEVEVFESRQAPAVIAGPDVAVDHACAGEPLVCRPAGAVTLSATTAVPGLELRWSVEPPPERPLDDGTRRVWLTPYGDGRTAAASIETDGTAISGDWIFRVEARDAYGAVGAAYTRVSIRNRPPVVIAEPPAPFPHAFDAAGSRFLSSGEIAWSVHDPDGDPIDVGATWRHRGDAGAPFTGELSYEKATFALEVSYAVPEDALLLRGGPELARTIEIVARDVNRTEGRADVTIEVGNRPPVPTEARAGIVVPHRFDAGGSRYVAVAELGAWADPDGDPLVAVAAAPPCDLVSVVDRTVSVTCSVPYDGTPAVERIAGSHAVRVRIRDAWDEGTNVVQDVNVLNSGPSLGATVEGFAFCSRVGTTRTCSGFVERPAVLVWDATFTARPAVFDPDGDPIAVVPQLPFGGSAVPQSAVCTNDSCVAFELHQPTQWRVCPREDPAPTRLLATDGAARVEIPASPPLTGCLY